MSLLSNHSLIRSSFHPNYISILERARTLGYTLPSHGQQVKQNRLLLWLVGKGIWNKLDVLYILATDGDSDYATLNWKSPSNFQLTKVNTPTFTSNQGFTGNGTSSYLDSGWTPSTHGVNFTLNNASFGGKINSGSSSQPYVEFGCSRAAAIDGSYFLGRFSGQIGYRINDAFTRQVAEASPIAFWHINRDGLSSKSVYKNGSSFNTASDNSAFLPDASYTILCLNNGGTKQSFSARQVSMSWTGASLISEANDFYTGWNTYQTSL